MLGRIGFDHLKIVCIIGDLPEERVQEQEIFIDLKVEIDLSRCARTDQLGDTVDYLQLAALCRRVAVEGQFQLIETFAVEVMKELLTLSPVIAAWVQVKKPGGVKEANYALIELHERKSLEVR